MRDALDRDAVLKLLVVHSELPHPDRDACSLRLYRLVELLVAEGHRISFIGRGSLDQERSIAALLAIGVHEVFPVDPERLGAVLGYQRSQWSIPMLDVPGLLRRGGFDAAWLSLYDVAEQYLPLIRRHAPATRIIVDSSDIQWLREHRGAEIGGDTVALAAAQATHAREQAVYGAADLCVAISEADAQATRELAPEVPVAIVSLAQPFDGIPARRSGRSGLVFVGNFHHAPNVDAVLHFHATTWPIVRRLVPDLGLTLVGTAPPPEIAALADDSITVTGWVPDVAPYLREALISIAPLRYGAGVKGKIAEAIAAGVPVVTTPIGAEGMEMVDGEHALIAADPEDFARAIARLHDDAGLWEHISAAAPRHLDAVVGRGAARAGLRDALRRVLPARWQASADMDGLPTLLSAFANTYAAGDAATLVLTVPRGDAAAPTRCGERVLTTLSALGLDPDAMADIEITWADDASPPGRTQCFDDSGQAPASAPEPASRGSSSRVAVALYPAPDPETLPRQLAAVGAALKGQDVDFIVVAGGYDKATSAIVDGFDQGRLLRCTRHPGRALAAELALGATTADVLLLLGPLSMPRPGFVAPLVEAVAAGASFAGPIINGAAGFVVADDGSLWPRPAGSAEPVGALPFDCLAATRETWMQAPRVLSPRDGHPEQQLGVWAQSRGPLVACESAHLDRHDCGPVSVIICTRNRCEELPDAIALLAASGATRGGNEVIIVDNASDDATAAVAGALVAAHPGVRLVYEACPGLSHARNTGAAAARNDELCYLDDDARPGPGWRESLSWALRLPGIAAAGGPICGLWPDERDPQWPPPGLEGALSVLDEGDNVGLLIPPRITYGANWAIRREALTQTGGFDAHLGYSPMVRIGGEEVAIAWRLHLRGIGVTVYVPGAAVGHRISADRMRDSYIVQRMYKVGIEHAHLKLERDGDSRARLLGEAETAAAQLMSVLALEGEMAPEEALDRIQAATLPLTEQVRAAEALGGLAATVLLLGECDVVIDGLHLRLRDEHLRGMLHLAPLPVGAHAA
jgi:glycosyltransferase involved in cell wall biosynthesis/GT2 family glycosyltransferase